MAKRVTTLFIRDTGINLLVMKGRQVEKWATLPLEPGLVSQGLVVDEERVAEKVEQLFKETGVQKKKVITGLSGHDSLYRIVTLPDLPEAVLPEAVKREAKRTMPTPLEEVYLSYQSLPATGEKHVFLATFPRNLADGLVRTLNKADVKPYVMDLAPLALCRIPNEPRAIIVNARLEHLDVMVIADRLPELIRRLSLPGEGESLEENLPLIAEEFGRTISFYNSSHMEKPLDSSVPVFVCGDLAEAPEAWQSLVGESGYSVSPLPSPVEPPDGFNANEFMVNMGLALKELLPEQEETNISLVNFNALPEAYLPEHFSIARVLIPVGIVVGIGLIVLGGILVLHNRVQIEALRSEVTVAEGLVTQQQRDITALKAQIGPMEDAADVLHNTITTLERGRASIYLDLREIRKLANDRNVSLNSITHQGNSIAISGSAQNVGAIYDYARDLRGDKTDRFSKVWVSPVSGNRKDGFNFTFSVTR
jgi:type IV pilus assembly protein PilM